MNRGKNEMEKEKQTVNKRVWIICFICAFYIITGMCGKIKVDGLIGLFGLEAEDCAVFNYFCDVLMLVGSGIGFMIANHCWALVKNDGISVFRCCFLLVSFTFLLFYVSLFVRNTTLEVIFVLIIGVAVSGLATAFDKRITDEKTTEP